MTIHETCPCGAWVEINANDLFDKPEYIIIRFHTAHQVCRDKAAKS